MTMLPPKENCQWCGLQIDSGQRLLLAPDNTKGVAYIAGGCCAGCAGTVAVQAADAFPSAGRFAWVLRDVQTTEDLASGEFTRRTT